MKQTILILLLAVLISCTPVTQEATTKPLVTQEPIIEKQTEQILEPEIKAPQEIIVPEANKTEEQITEEPQIKLTEKEICEQDCAINCQTTAQNACTQKGRPDCKAICSANPIIDPSACTQACTYVENQPNACKVRMEEWCSAQCVKNCR